MNKKIEVSIVIGLYLFLELIVRLKIKDYRKNIEGSLATVFWFTHF